MVYELKIGQYEAAFEVYSRKSRKECSASYYQGDKKLSWDELPPDVLAEFEKFEEECFENWEDDSPESPIEWSNHD